MRSKTQEVQSAQLINCLDKELVLTVVNPHVTEARETEIGIRTGRITSGTVVTLTHADIRAHNSFEQRSEVGSQTRSVEITGRMLVHTFPPASVTKLALHLG